MNNFCSQFVPFDVIVENDELRPDTAAEQNCDRSEYLLHNLAVHISHAAVCG